MTLLQAHKGPCSELISTSSQNVCLQNLFRAFRHSVKSPCPFNKTKCSTLLDWLVLSTRGFSRLRFYLCWLYIGLPDWQVFRFRARIFEYHEWATQNKVSVWRCTSDLTCDCLSRSMKLWKLDPVRQNLAAGWHAWLNPNQISYKCKQNIKGRDLARNLRLDMCCKAHNHSNAVAPTDGLMSIHLHFSAKQKTICNSSIQLKICSLRLLATDPK